MHKNMVNKHLIDALITSKLNVSDKLYVLDDYSLAYLEQIKNIYNCDDYKNNNDYVAKSREIPTPAAKQCLLLDN